MTLAAGLIAFAVALSLFWRTRHLRQENRRLRASLAVWEERERQRFHERNSPRPPGSARGRPTGTRHSQEAT